MNNAKTLALVATLAAGLALLPSDAQAQRWRRDRPPVARRDWTVRPLVVATERESNAFRAWFERSRFARERALKRNVQQMDEALERLRLRASDGRAGVGRDELNDALREARVIDRQIAPRRQGPAVNREWNDLRRTLNDLARVYGVRGV